MQAWQQRHEQQIKDSGALEVRSPASVSRGPSLSFDAPPMMCLGDSAMEAAPLASEVSPLPCISDASLAADVAELGYVPTKTAAAPARGRCARGSKRPRTYTT